MGHLFLKLTIITLCALISSCTVNQYYTLKNHEKKIERLDGAFYSSIVIFSKNFSASGAIIKIVDSETSYAITVKHYCSKVVKKKVFAAASPHGSDFVKFEVEIDRVHEYLDLCVVKLKGDTTKLSPFKISTTYPSPGSKVFSLGAPAASWPNKNVGFVSSIIRSKEAVDKKLTYSDVIMVSIPCSPGSSGSPIYNSDGHMVGIIVAVHPSFHHNSLGITSAAILEFTSYIK